MNDARARAERFVRSPVHLGDLALAFDATTAATVDVEVAGRAFFPLILDDIASATSSVHVNQYGFRPGEVGEPFARALLAKAAEGVAVRVVVDRVGSRPRRSGGFYERLRAGGVDVRVMGAPGRIDHRKLFVIDGRVGWVGGAGIEDHFADGRFHDLFVRLTGPYVADKAMIRRIASAARRGVRIRMFVPAHPNNRACAAAQRFHHRELMDAGVRILGTCNLEAWSLKRFIEIDVRVRSREFAARFDERFSAPAEAVSTPGSAPAGIVPRLEAAAFAALSPLL